MTPTLKCSQWGEAADDTGHGPVHPQTHTQRAEHAPTDTPDCEELAEQPLHALASTQRDAAAVVRLPGATSAGKRPGAASHPAAPRSSGLHQARVLLVDDEPLVTQVASRMLRPYAVTVVGSAIEAQARIDQGDRFEAILSDVNMPHMTGMDLHAWLAIHHPLETRCMAFMTGLVSPKLQVFLERIKAHCLLKPFGKNELRQIVDELIANHQLLDTTPQER